jgi:hypothetical protein
VNRTALHRAGLRLGAAAALALLVPLAACSGGTSYSSRCGGGTCTVNLTGEQTFEVDGLDGVERYLHVGPIEPDAVTVSWLGDGARLTAGQTAQVDGVLPVEVVSVSGRDVTLRLAGTDVDSAADDDRYHYRAARYDQPDVVYVDAGDPGVRPTTTPRATPTTTAAPTTTRTTTTRTSTSTRTSSRTTTRTSR